MPLPIIISASRRTDIPAFYMDWFMERIDKGYFETVNPYNQKTSRISAAPENVHSIVFWSKNFSHFIEGGFGEKLIKKGFHLFFNFSVNADNDFLEPHVPDLSSRIAQVRALCERFGPAVIHWRFDPICFFSRPDGSRGNNIGGFREIAGHMAELGIQRCISSFMDHYAKIQRRPKPYAGFTFLEPTMEEKKTVLQKMASITNALNIKLYTCCEKALMAQMPAETGVKSSACIPGQRLADLFGGRLSLKKDTGQRTKQGCGCTASRDIGIYAQQPCYHNCLFCYANPADKRSQGTASALFPGT